MQKGFIQIPVLIAIIVGLLVLGGGGYFGVKQYQEKQELKLLIQEQQQKIEVEKEKLAKNEEKAKEEELQTFMEGQQNALKDAQSEIEKLKKQTESQKTTPTLVKETTSYNSAKSGILSNAEIISKVKPATVYIETTEGVGSGMIIDINGYILTNAHVVWDVSSAKVKLSNGRSFSAEVIGRDEIVDLAILKIMGTSFPKVILGNSDNVVQGDDVFTLGYPFGLEGDVSFKEGTISRRISDGDATYLETSAEIHPGNSGGPLVNDKGEVVGINTAVLGNSIGGVTVGETIKFAIPVNVAKSLIPQLKEGRSVIVEHPKELTENQLIAFDCDEFSDLIIDIKNTSIEILEMYGDSGLEENPDPENFDYPYNKSLAQQNTYYGKIDQFLQKINQLDDYNSTVSGKNSLTQAANDFREAFGMRQAGFEQVNADAYTNFGGYMVIPPANIDQSKIYLDQAQTKAYSAVNMLTNGTDELENISTSNQCD